MRCAPVAMSISQHSLLVWTLEPSVPARFCCCLVLTCVWLFQDPMDCIPPGSSVHGVLQTRTLEWVAISFCRGSSWFRDQTRISCIAGDPPGKPQHILLSSKRPHGSQEWISWGLRKSRMAGHSSPSSNGWPGIFSQVYRFKPHYNTVRKKKPTQIHPA